MLDLILETPFAYQESRTDYKGQAEIYHLGYRWNDL